MTTDQPQACEQVPTRESDVLSAEQFLAMEVDEREMMLDPILTSNSQAMLYGPRGLGKTFVALGIAYAAASGGSFLGWRANRPHNVVYVDGEMGAAALKQRLLQLGPPPPRLSLWVNDLQKKWRTVDLTRMDDYYFLRSQMTAVELIVVDNLASLTGGSPDRWQELQQVFLMQRKHHTAMLLVHHANKEGGQRGTSRREDILDLVMAIRRPADYEPRQGARFEIHFEKARGLLGAATDPIEAWLKKDEAGAPKWHWQPAQINHLERVVALMKAGMNGIDIARTLGLATSYTYRLRSRALELKLVDQPAAKAVPLAPPS